MFQPFAINRILRFVPAMKARRVRLGLVLAALALLLTGCVWTRLLDFKKQLAEFDRYVKVEERNGLMLHFVKPVLDSGDILFLMELDPTRRETNGTRQIWFWTFRKLLPPTNSEPGNFDLTFSTAFATNKLVSFTLSERFLASIPKPVLLGAMRSFGNAEVDTGKKTAKMRWAGTEGDHKDWHGISREALHQLLGAPWSVSRANGLSTLLYRYRLDSPGAGNNGPLMARVWFTFNDATGVLAKVQADYGGLRLFYVPEQIKNGKARAQKPERKTGTDSRVKD